MSIIGICAIIIAIVCTIFVVHKDYEDGLIGRIALSGVILACIVVSMVDLFVDARYKGSPLELQLLIGCLTVFVVRHLYRFDRFVRCKHQDVMHWPPAHKMMIQKGESQ